MCVYVWVCGSISFLFSEFSFFFLALKKAFCSKNQSRWSASWTCFPSNLTFSGFSLPSTLPFTVVSTSSIFNSPVSTRGPCDYQSLMPTSGSVKSSVLQRYGQERSTPRRSPKNGSPFYWRACCLGYYPLRAQWRTTTLGVPAQR